MAAPNDSPRPVASVPAVPYRADRGFDGAGVLFMGLSLSMAAALLGYLGYWVHKFMWVPFLFPSLLGLSLGGLGCLLVQAAHLRNRWIGGLVGLCAGGIALLALHYFDWADFRKTAMTQAPELAAVPINNPEALRAIAAQYVDPKTFEKQVLAMHGVPAYLDLQAHKGLTFKRRTRHSELNLGYVGSYLYWAVELLLVGSLTMALVSARCAEPYCRRCRRWKTSSQLGSLQAQEKLAQQALEQGDLGLVLACGPTPLETCLNLHVSICDRCQGDRSPADLQLVHWTLNRDHQRQSTFLPRVTWPSDSVPVLRALFGKSDD